MKLAKPRTGQRLLVKQKQVPFSYWPAIKGPVGPASLQPLLFALDPWAIIERVVNKRCPAVSKPEALACLEQAKDFFINTTSAGVVASRPLTMYYSFMNLVKALCLTRGPRTTFDKAEHGISEQLRAPNVELTNAFLKAFPSPSPTSTKLQNFAELMSTLTGAGLTTPYEYDLPVLLPQIVPGHRLWAQAAGQPERFIAIHDIQFWHQPTASQIWFRLYFVEEDLKRLGVTQKRLLEETGLDSICKKVLCKEKADGKQLICLEQKTPLTYAGFPSDALNTLASQVRWFTWATVSIVKPYRRYYAYLCPTAERPSTLPQLLSIYAISYYLGSITRYRPHHFDKIVDSEYGPRIQDFITGQPLQFLYLIASEFAEQDVSKPAIL